jgi:phospholipid/cholesterol/gamma-HCH transport system substrate-binding protein
MSKAFTERNPKIIGGIVIGLILAGTLGSLLLTAGVLKGQYVLKARFVDSAGLHSGDKVRVAGVPSGSVDAIRQAGDRVEVALKINNGVELSRDTRADVIVETLLGTKYVRLVTGNDWSRKLEGGDVITKTSSPTEVLDLQNIGTPILEKTDTAGLNKLLDSLAQVTEGKQEEVARIIDGLNRFTAVVNARDTQARSLIDSAGRLSGTLARRDQDLVAVVDNLSTVVRSLAVNRVQLAALLNETAAAARQTADLIGVNRPKLDAILDELHQDLAIVSRHQVDLAQGAAYLGVAIQGFSSIGYSGPDETPQPWANIFTQGLGGGGIDALLGACGALDDALDLALGADPAPCSARTGPLPGQQPAAPAAATTSRPAPIATSLDRILAPLLRGTS